MNRTFFRGTNMAWYDEAVFYHIYPLGLTGAPKQNPYGEPVHRLNTLLPWIGHIQELGCSALYIGPLFESVGHGYETTDYRKLDSRLGTNEDLTAFVDACHEKGIRVILDGVFNHTGRDFFAFRDIQNNRENSRYRDWYCNVNFWGNNSYNDGFSYDNWGGHDLLVKLNQRNPEVQTYICDVIRFWVSEFHIDGIRLDAADVLDFDFMKLLRRTANEVKPDFWLMGEVIHGEYSRWANQDTLHAVTNYHLHKALYSGHNDHNYFEIAHTVKRLYGMGGNRPDGLKLYNFVDNHDVERIYTKLNNKAHFIPVHILLYTLPGVPSVYYGSEFGIEGKKVWGSDDSLRPALNLEDYKDALEKNPFTAVIARLGKARRQIQALSYGHYREILLTNRQYGFSREMDGEKVFVTVNNDDAAAQMTLPAGEETAYVGVLSGRHVPVKDGYFSVEIPAAGGEIWVGEKEYRKLELEQDAVVPVIEEKKSILQDVPEVSETAENCEKTSAQDETGSIEKTEDKQHLRQEEARAEAPVCIEKQQVSQGDTGFSENTPVSGNKSSGRMNTPIPENKSYEEMTVEELQQVIYEKMKKNGPVTERMYQDIIENLYHNSLVNWAKSF